MKKRIFGAPTVPPPADDDSDQEFTPTYAKSKVKSNNFNPYELLVSESHEKGSEDSKEEEDPEAVSEEEAPAAPKPKPKRKKKKKKAQKKEADDEDEDEVERCVRQVNELLGTPTPCATTPTTADHASTPSVPNFMTVQNKYLNVCNEVQKKFTVDLRKEDNPARERRLWSRQTTLTYYKQDWIPVRNTDLHMSLVSVENGIKYFTFKHGESYQKVQQMFFDCIRRNDLDTIGNVLLQCLPYHIDSMILTSFSLGTLRNFKESREYIEMAIFAMEHVLHPQFNFHSGKCRLPYKYYENRSFHILLLRYVRCHYNMACHRTALEICKLLMSLDPGDPLAVILVIDSVALRAKEFSWLIDAIERWDREWQALNHPNLAYSYALSHYCLSAKKSESVDRAEELLKNAIRRFPSAVLQLLEKCGSTKLRTFQEMDYYKIQMEKGTGRVLRWVTFLLAQRQWPLWKWPRNLAWLERVAAEVGEEPVSAELTDWRVRRYRHPPAELLRHLCVLDNSKIPTLSTPSASYYPTNPFPPADGISPYNKTTNTSGNTQERSTSSSVLNVRVNVDNVAANEPMVLREAEMHALALAMRERLRNMERGAHALAPHPDSDSDID